MSLSVRTITDLGEIPAPSWDALTHPDDPFSEHTFLYGMERSGAVGGEDTGMTPCHITVWRGRELVGAMPLYLKTHSYGEFIFDWGWAEAAMRAGIVYYPKLVSQIPWTPVTGPRLLIAPGEDYDEVGEALLRGARSEAERTRASGIHFLFNTAREAEWLAARGYMARSSYQFHWHRGPGWSSFDDYLAAMRAQDRKHVRRERRGAAAHGLTLAMKTGAQLSPAEWRALYALYRVTHSTHGSPTYLPRAFFEHLQYKAPHRVMATFASQGETPIAGALFLTRGEALYGRYWGDRGRHEFMHFELCYYLPIEWALSHGIQRVEAGAQGEHKLKRGFLPSPCHSNYWIRHPALADAIERFLPREAGAVGDEMTVLAHHGPFKRERRH